MLIASMYDANGDLAVPGVAAQEPVGGLQRDLDEATVREDAGIVDSYRLAGTGSLASRLCTAERDRDRLRRASGRGLIQRGQPRDHVPPVPAHRAEPAPAGGAGRACRVPAGTRPVRRRGEGHQVGERHGLGDNPNAVATKDALAAMEEAFGVAPINKGEGGSIPFIPELQRIFPSAQVLVTDPEDPKANAHSPNESISLPGLKNNILAEALLLAKLGE